MAQTPRFKNPPVVETVLSIQFERLVNFKSVDFGPLWERFRKDFPIAEDWPPLPPTTEFFGRPQNLMLDPSQHWNVLPAPALPRLLLRKKTSSRQVRHVIQIQPDRFIHNWARSDPKKEPYPSYKKNRKEFLSALGKLNGFVADRGWDPVKPRLAEVTYINRVPLSCKEEQAQVITSCFPGVHLGQSDAFLPQMETVAIDRSFPIGERGCLQMLIRSPVELQEGSFAVDFRLLARVSPSPDAMDPGNMLDLAHEWVVNGFKSLTTPEMHQLWEFQK